MHGNVWQWCDNLYDPTSASRVRRGGGFASDGDFCRAALRGRTRPAERASFLGFRIARVPVEGKAEPPKPKDGPLGMKFVPLPKATFYMGRDSENCWRA